MNKTDILDKLSKLSDIYRYTEIFYIDAAAVTKHSVISVFYGKRAFERMDFLEGLHIEKNRLLIENKNTLTVDEAITSWKSLYGFEYLNAYIFAENEVYDLEKHLIYFLEEFIKEEIPGTLRKILNQQLSCIKAGLLSLEFLHKYVSR
jgi:hypothetical protein